MNKVAIVTGGAKGIGKEIVIALAKKGIIVIANYNKSEKEAYNLKKELEQNNIYIDIFKADVSNREEAEKLVKYVIDKYKNIDILINNAGITDCNLFTDIDDECWNKVINNNLYSAFIMCQNVLKNMISRKQGCIINISSIWGIVGASCESVYAISKAGMDALTKSLAKELGPSGIRVNSIAPGIIDTDMNSKLNENEINDIKKEIPLEKIGKPKDIARCVEWLICDEYTTGQIFSINGGWIIT